MYGSSKIGQSYTAPFRQAEDNSTRLTFMPEWLEMIDEICQEIIVLPFNADQEPPFTSELSKENGRPIFNAKCSDHRIQFKMNNVNADAPLIPSHLDGIVLHCKTADVCSAIVIKSVTEADALNSNKKFKEHDKPAYKLLKRAKER